MGCGELTDMVTLTQNHLYCQNVKGLVHKGFVFVKRFYNMNYFQKSNQNFGIKILIKYNIINIRKIISNQTA